ncbi:MAG: hypothetical protein N2376_02665 [Clostridia bacterium]|nr:hypothetical protein [Clostridia bacterium]
MNLTLEQIISVMGSCFELTENRGQGYDSYVYANDKVTFEFDRINKKLSTIIYNDVPYYVYSGTLKSFDINGDSKPEKIAAYDDQDFNGSITVWNSPDKVLSQAVLAYSGGKMDLTFEPQIGASKENLVIVKTRGGIHGDILKWAEGTLQSVLPKGIDTLSQELAATIEGDSAVLVHQKRDILYVCPLPEATAKNVESLSGTDRYRYAVSILPEVAGENLSLKVRTSLLLKVSDQYNAFEDTEGIYSDVGQVTQSFSYLGNGNWQENAITGGAKYEKGAKATVQQADLSIGNVHLLDEIAKKEPELQKSLSKYTEQEITDGLLIPYEGLDVGVSDGLVNYISLEAGSDKTTSKGLKIGDAKETALSMYGLPDKGFTEDDVWSYYSFRKDTAQKDNSFLLDTLNIEFDGGKVSRIWISAYITAY